MNKVILNGVDLSIEDVVNVARNGYQVEIDKDYGTYRRSPQLHGE